MDAIEVVILEDECDECLECECIRKNPNKIVWIFLVLNIMPR